MESGIYDQAADEIVRRFGLVKEEIIRRNKGKKPFRMEKMSKQDQLAEYLTMPEEKKTFLRQEFPEFNQHELDMQGLMEEQNA